MDKKEIRKIIATRVAKEFKDGDLVNLGIGLPTLVANYVPGNIDVTFHSENGFIGMGPAPEEGEENKNLTNAGGQPVTLLKGAAIFDSAMSFAIIRGGHLDCTVLGALQVDAKGNLANWMIPGKKVPGMGGAMDLVTGAKKVIVAMEHTARGAVKIFEECNLPLTAVGVVDLIVTEMGVMKVTDKGLVLTEYNPQFTVEDIQAVTEATLSIDENLKEMM
ncbi:CoA transferase subunit B [Acidaminobacter sp. JC074]|uniref:3-oxoacid CoA-transferase subunit B n=1 Tax=Acidaminobacter sp. JC074 TaxID=2530199 RepID=UPI001F113C8F|nr:3-oxoacid CoA-transferase subunit B [Acidaminobacter sp. JC074]MCH4889343.1 CoA transferase subunit B [Acidaminobacter sp. JC074]